MPTTDITNPEAKEVLEKFMSTLPPKQVKPFYKTSEFWLHMLANAGGALAAFKGYMSPNLYAILLTLSNGAYALARGLAKH